MRLPEAAHTPLLGAIVAFALADPAQDGTGAIGLLHKLYYLFITCAWTRSSLQKPLRSLEILTLGGLPLTASGQHRSLTEGGM